MTRPADHSGRGLAADANRPLLLRGLPWGRRRILERWLAPSVVAWPAALGAGGAVALVSSRLGHLRATRRPWFRGLRGVVQELAGRGGLLLTASQTTTAPWVERCAWWYGVPVVQIHVAAPGRVRRPSPTGLPCAADRAAVVRCELRLVGPREEAGPWQRLPLRDRAVVAAAERLVVLGLRRCGVLEQLIRRRLEERWLARPRVDLLVGEGLVPPGLAEELVACGARVLWAAGREHLAGARDAEVIGPRSPPDDGVVLAPSQVTAGRWLLHCTRGCAGPWPDQSEHDYLDELIFERGEFDRSPLVVLRRILTMRRLVAGRRAIRGGTPVVCFSAARLEELPTRRVFRPHRSRWDFEPYGLGIRASWLAARGARPVRYGNDQTWALLPPDLRPFFQVEKTRRGTVRWTDEQEWRHLGDVSLADLPTSAAFVFVPTVQDARGLAAVSPWPVVALELASSDV